MAPDIAIVGGGPSGLALAAMLEKNGFDYTVYERDAKDQPPAGGCLDLHAGSGQRAMKEAGCFDEMRKRGRLGEATIAKVYDHNMNFVFSWGEGRDAPELDRVDIRASLLTVVPESRGNGEYRIDLGFNGAEDLGNNGTVDLEDSEAVKALMLDPHYFRGHATRIQDLIKALEGPFKAWPLWYYPTEHLNWKSAPGVTLMGDAAHCTPPWAGDGVNCALRDAIILSHKLKEFGLTQKAIEEYEKEMFPFAIDVITRSLTGAKLFFHWNSPQAFLEGIKVKPVFGTTDDY